MTKLDREIKQKWIDALRSGKYTQCKHVLQNEDGHNCCLGVLGKVVGVSEDILTNDNNGTTDEYPDFLPLDYSTCRQFTTFNDHQELSFKQIADKVEELL